MTDDNHCATTKADGHLATLRELTENLPDVPHGSPPRKRYVGEGGAWIGTGLWHEPAFAVQICEAPAGVMLPAHFHEGECRERLLVVSGLIRVEMNGVENVFGVGSCAEFAPGQAHQVTTLKPTRIVAVTIPAEEDYPYGHDHAAADA